MRERGLLSRRLLKSLFYSTQVVEDVAHEMYSGDQHQWQRNVFGHSFNVVRQTRTEGGENTVAVSAMNTVKSWLRAHEDAQVMLASILVIVGLWWLVRAMLDLVINLICPLLVVLLAVVCVPQLRAPLIGQNYPALANVLRSILLKLADNIKQN